MPDGRAGRGGMGAGWEAWAVRGQNRVLWWSEWRLACRRYGSGRRLAKRLSSRLGGTSVAACLFALALSAIARAQKTVYHLLADRSAFPTARLVRDRADCA